MREFLDGNTAIARAAIDAGCDFFAGYPITPATPILQAMMRDLPRVGGIAVQGEDEIASIGFCIGAAMAGRRALTATSGPGISLYSENLGLAQMGEVPLVVVDVQRLGPATGGATTVAQGDVQFVRWGTSGGYPLIALSPATVADCYNLTLRAFDLAERFRCPVFVLTDKEVASTMDTVDTEELEPIPVRAREIASPECAFEPCNYPSLDQNVAMSPFGGPHLLRFTTSTHDEQGYLTKNPVKIDRLNHHLIAKIERHQDEIDQVRADLQEGAEVLLISYGITARAVEEAVRYARAEGKRLSALTLLSLWPLPEKAIGEAIASLCSFSHAQEQGREEIRIVVAELNDGQLRREVERIVCRPLRSCRPQRSVQVIGVHRIDGELITPQQILQAGGVA